MSAIGDFLAGIAAMSAVVAATVEYSKWKARRTSERIMHVAEDILDAAFEVTEHLINAVRLRPTLTDPVLGEYSLRQFHDDARKRGEVYVTDFGKRLELATATDALARLRGASRRLTALLGNPELDELLALLDTTHAEVVSTLELMVSVQEDGAEFKMRTLEPTTASSEDRALVQLYFKGVRQLMSLEVTVLALRELAELGLAPLVRDGTASDVDFADLISGLVKEHRASVNAQLEAHRVKEEESEKPVDSNSGPSKA